MLDEQIYGRNDNINKKQQAKLKEYQGKVKHFSNTAMKASLCKYRTRYHYYYKIIKTASIPNRYTGKVAHKQTTLMYNSCMSYSQLASYMVNIIGYNLLDYNDKDQTFTPTSKGYEFIKRYESLAELVPEMLEEMPEFTKAYYEI